MGMDNGPGSSPLAISIDVDDVAGLREQAGAAAEAGYDACQLFYRGADLDERRAAEIREVCDEHGLAVPLLGGYINALQPEEAPMGVTLGRLLRLIDLMPVLGSHGVILWSGTLSDEHVFQSDPRTHTEEAFDRLAAVTETVLHALGTAGGTLLYEPFFTHVLRDADSILALLDRFQTDRLGIVMDPPNFLTPDSYEEADALFDRLFEVLDPHIGAVHFKDYLRQHAGDWPFEYPGPGQGEMDYPRLARHLRRYEVDVPYVVEHVGPDEYASARRFVETKLAGSGS